MQPVAAGPIDRELEEGEEEQAEQGRGEGLLALGFDAQKKESEIDRGENGERDEESDQQFARRAVIGEGVAVQRRMGPEVLADFRREPETVEAEGHDLEQRAISDEVTKLLVGAGEIHARGCRRLLRRRRVRNWLRFCCEIRHVEKASRARGPGDSAFTFAPAARAARAPAPSPPPRYMT